MPCEKYQDALIDLAAANAEPAGEVREHVEVCSSCRAYFEQERWLLASIDCGIRQVANAPLPAALLQRFEARLAQQPPSRLATHPSRIYAFAAIATAAALVLLVLPLLRTREAKQLGVVSAVARQESAGQAEKIAQAAPPVLASKLAPKPERHFGKRVSQPRRPSEAEVFVPPDERIAFERFLSDLNGREDLAVALVKPLVERHERRDESVETRDLEIVALTVQPLTVKPLRESDDK